MQHNCYFGREVDWESPCGKILVHSVCSPGISCWRVCASEVGKSPHLLVGWSASNRTSWRFAGTTEKCQSMWVVGQSKNPGCVVFVLSWTFPLVRIPFWNLRHCICGPTRSNPSLSPSAPEFFLWKFTAYKKWDGANIFTWRNSSTGENNLCQLLWEAGMFRRFGFMCNSKQELGNGVFSPWTDLKWSGVECKFHVVICLSFFRAFNSSESSQN